MNRAYSPKALMMHHAPTRMTATYLVIAAVVLAQISGQHMPIQHNSAKWISRGEYPTRIKERRSEPRGLLDQEFTPNGQAFLRFVSGPSLVSSFRTGIYARRSGRSVYVQVSSSERVCLLCECVSACCVLRVECCVCYWVRLSASLSVQNRHVHAVVQPKRYNQCVCAFMPVHNWMDGSICYPADTLGCISISSIK